MVAVTGVGVVTPLGIGRDAFWRALAAGRSACEGAPDSASVGELTVPGLELSPQLRRMDRLSRMAVIASRLALADAGLDAGAVPPGRLGIVLGSSVGNTADSITYLDRVLSRGPAAASPLVFPNLVMNAPAAYVAMELGATGVNLTVAQAEVTGESAVALGADTVRAGRADAVLAGGCDELSVILTAGYARTRALAGQCGGRRWSSPYDVQRSGVVLGEGAAMLLLEPLARARSRGSSIYAVIDGTASFALPSPRYDWPDSSAAAPAALRALVEGRGTIDLICGGANSSRRLDAAELALLAGLFGERAPAVRVTSIKGAVGEHGAAGALTIAAACCALREQVLPPVCNLETPEPGAPFAFAPRRGTPASLRRVLVCGLARGGAGVALSLRGAEC